LTGWSSASPPSRHARISQAFRSAGKGEVIRPNGKEPSSGPFALCEGWAYRFYRLPDGQRQILSVLIPGDLFSAFDLLDSHPDFSVQAATDVKLCQLRRDEIKSELSAAPDVLDEFGKTCAIEIEAMAATSIDLGRRDHGERIAGFVRRLVKRLSARGIGLRSGVYEFPLSDADIADATGLTPDDVSRALTNLRADGVIDISNGLLTVLDPAKLAVPQPTRLENQAAAIDE
jgi:CRP-like cAMP-binding protein